MQVKHKAKGKNGQDVIRCDRTVRVRKTRDKQRGRTRGRERNKNCNKGKGRASFSLGFLTLRFSLPYNIQLFSLAGVEKRGGKTEE